MVKPHSNPFSSPSKHGPSPLLQMVKPPKPRPNPLKPISSPSKHGPNPPQTHSNPLLQMVKPTQTQAKPTQTHSSPSKHGQTHPNPAQTHQTHPKPTPIPFYKWSTPFYSRYGPYNTSVPTRRCRLPQAFQYYTNDFWQSVNAVTWNRWACKKLLLIYLKTCCAGNRALAPTSEPKKLVICGRWCYQQNVLGNMEKRGSAFLLVPKRFDVLDALRAGVSSLHLLSTRLWSQEPIFSAWKITKSVGHTGVPAQYEEQPLQQTSQNHVCCCYVA